MPSERTACAINCCAIIFTKSATLPDEKPAIFAVLRARNTLLYLAFDLFNRKPANVQAAFKAAKGPPVSFAYPR